jgi:heat shock protein HslJ
MLVGLVGCSSSAAGSFSATWGAKTSGQPSVTIASDDSFSGTDGCNRLKGTGSVSGDTFAFGPIASTLMACEGVDTWFSKAATAKISGSELVVYDESGAKIGTLDKR